MSDEPEDMSMRLLRVMNVDTIDSNIALKLAEMVIRHNYNFPDSYDFSLTVNDKGDRWEVMSKLIYPAPEFDNDQYGQKILFIVQKSNCKIIKFNMIAVPLNP